MSDLDEIDPIGHLRIRESIFGLQFHLELKIQGRKENKNLNLREIAYSTVHGFW